MQVLSTTPRRLLALAGAIGVVTGAIAGVLALLPKSPETLSAHFEGVTATPEVSLEQYDARATPIGATRTASAGLPSYRPAADTMPYATATAGEEERKGHTGTAGTTATGATATGTTATGRTATGTTATGTTRTSAANHLSRSTSTQTNTTPTTRSTTSTTETPEPPSQPSGRHVTSKGAKRRGGKLALGSSSAPYPQEKPAAPTRQAVAAPPPARSLHPVTGALVSEGAGVSHGSVAAVAALLAAKPVEEAAKASPPAEASTQTTSVERAQTTSATPTTAPPTLSSTAPVSRIGAAQSTHVVLPARCRSRTCGATQEIERALTYDPNPVKAAEAVAAIFDDSRAEVVGRDLYPLGAEVTYNLTLKGFAHSTATIVWSLVGKAAKRPLARPWWRDIVVAHVTPTVNEESLDGSFWVPMPPEHGDYLVKLYLLDSTGVPHATSFSEPAFH